MCDFEGNKMGGGGGGLIMGEWMGEEKNPPRDRVESLRGDS